MAEYVLPSLGADMEAATLVEWHVAPNDVVKKGQVVGLVETEKAVMDIEFFQDGVIEEILVPVGEKIAVGTPLLRFRPVAAAALVAAEAPAIVRAAPAALAMPPAPAATAAPAIARAAPAALAMPPAPQVASPAPSVQAVAISAPLPSAPLGHRIHLPVKRLAEELGVDLARVAGTGPGGQVMKRDVRAAAAQAEGGPAVSRSETETGQQPISPRARRLAEEYGIDLSAVVGTGPQGSVSAADIEHAVRGRAQVAATAETPPAPSGDLTAVVAPPPTPPPTAEVPAAVEAPAPPAGPTDSQRAAERQLAMRHAIAVLMARSKREIPHYYLTLDIDMQRAMRWLEQENLARPMAERLLPAALLIKATALALREIPEMNGFWVDDHFVAGSGIHVGVAISLRGGGLAAPAIHDADQKSLGELMASLRDLVGRTRSGSLHRAEMADPTITVTNLGDQGVDSVLGVIYPPQVALVGFGRIQERPVAIEGLVGARPVVTATLAADHRNSDGHRGGVFLAAINRRLQEPEQL